MDFNSLKFLFIFLPLFLAVFFMLQPGYKKWYLLAASVLFYYFFQKNNLAFIVGLIVVNYFLLVWMDKNAEKPGVRRAIFWGTIALNLLVLIFFKVTQTRYWVTSSALNSFPGSAFLHTLAFPLGLSFITFQILSCLIDSSRPKGKRPQSVWDYLTYLLFFPKIVVGPITRFSTFEPQLLAGRFSWTRTAEGARRFIIGLAKKAIIADQLAVIANPGFALDRPAYSTSVAWVVIIAYTLQIYYDFSGYIDMALGIARILGFDLPENFNAPYLSKSLSDFWRRWHMTLTSWFRDYVFYPLEYKRRRTKFLRVETDTLLVFLLTGLWHGLTPNFVVWGLLQGAVLVFENSRYGAWIKKLPAFLQHLYLIGVVMVSWVFFRSQTLLFSLQFLKRLIVINQNVPLNPYSASQPLPIINNSVLLIIVIGILGLLPWGKMLHWPWLQEFGQTEQAKWAVNFGYLCLFVIAIAFVVSQFFVPSLYGNF